ncbi:MAG: IS1595 family transposase [Brevundimonas sp.]|uniref:IS1595 family transposase n=1 Tax=Brevundimonas sp. TaxID=1871086 RepID=UPI00258666AD|nr:IS1595 family transposase [Brevundimonas sp.]MCV0414125.1 IS1595 family transposase [Brevundimonas sp.]
MSQHFLLSARARTISIRDVARLGDEEAYALFKSIRFVENAGEPFCPYCGIDAVYEYRSRRVFKCKGCDKQFSATSGTVFRSRKMSYADIMLAVVLFVNGVNGNAALRLSRDLGCSYKTAFVLHKKLSRVMASMQAEVQPTGMVDIDGAYIGGSIRQENLVKDRKGDGRKQFNTKRRSIVTARERRIGGRSRAWVVPTEKAADPSLKRTVNAAAHVVTDESPAYSRYFMHFADHSTVNHSVGLVVDGVHTNLIEAQHARIRRAERGVYLHINGNHAQRFADELSWRDDFRRLDNGQQFRMVLTRALKLSPDLELVGYWQKRPEWLRSINRRRGLRALTLKRKGRPSASISTYSQAATA